MLPMSEPRKRQQVGSGFRLEIIDMDSIWIVWHAYIGLLLTMYIFSLDIS